MLAYVLADGLCRLGPIAIRHGIVHEDQLVGGTFLLVPLLEYFNSVMAITNLVTLDAKLGKETLQGKYVGEVVIDYEGSACLAHHLTEIERLVELFFFF